MVFKLERIPRVSHLLFVDDSLLFCTVGLEEAHKLKAILTAHEDASGQEP